MLVQQKNNQAIEEYYKLCTSIIKSKNKQVLLNDKNFQLLNEIIIFTIGYGVNTNERNAIKSCFQFIESLLQVNETRHFSFVNNILSQHITSLIPAIIKVLYF